MRKVIYLIGVIVLLGSVLCVGKGFLSREEFMSIEKAEQRWGSQPFDPKVFKTGNQKIRGLMAVALIKSKRYIGKPISSVREELGNWDGYFETDGIPAYFIESSKTGSKEVWEILFLPDKKNPRNVGEVRIHKNCC